MSCGECKHLRVQVVALQESLDQLTRNMRRVGDTYVINLIDTFGPGRSARLAALLQEVDNRSAIQKITSGLQARNRTVETTKSCNGA